MSVKSRKADMSEKSADTVKTKANYIKHYKTAEVKDGIKQKPSEIAPKTRVNTSVSSAPTPKTKEQSIKDARKKYVSEKLKTKAEAEKTARQNHTSDMPIHNGNLPKTNAELIKSDMSAPNVNSENMLDTAFSSKSMLKTKESYIRSHGKAPSDLIKTPDRAKTMPKQNTHTLTRNVSTGTKRPFGLDCSGFVTWSFINSGFNASSIGHGTKGQLFSAVWLCYYFSRAYSAAKLRSCFFEETPSLL